MTAYEKRSAAFQSTPSKQHARQSSEELAAERLANHIATTTSTTPLRHKRQAWLAGALAELCWCGTSSSSGANHSGVPGH